MRCIHQGLVQQTNKQGSYRGIKNSTLVSYMVYSVITISFIHYAEEEMEGISKFGFQKEDI